MRFPFGRLQAGLVLLTAALLAACAPAATAAPTAVPVTPSPAPTPTMAGPYYDNPVYAEDFPDPHILRVGNTYYGYATNSSNANIPVIRSTDLAHWERLGDAVPALPDWAALDQRLVWAPGVIQAGEGFVLYHVAREPESGLQCISRGASASPEGPFQDELAEPFICQKDLGGSIDPYPYRDEDGQLYLLWKNDGNCCGKSVGLWIQPLSPDGLTLTGQATELIQMDQPWERPLIENPALVRDGGQYYLFYSGNWWASHEYAVSYAVCETALGPCVKPRKEPWFIFGNDAMGPGGEAFFTDTAGNLWMAYHAWTGLDIGYPAGERSLRIEPVRFAGGQPAALGPTTDPQPMP